MSTSPRARGLLSKGASRALARLGRRARLMGRIQAVLAVVCCVATVLLTATGVLVELSLSGLVYAILGGTCTLLCTALFVIQGRALARFGRGLTRFRRGEREGLKEALDQLRVNFIFEVFFWAGLIIPFLILQTALIVLVGVALAAIVGGGL